MKFLREPHLFRWHIAVGKKQALCGLTLSKGCQSMTVQNYPNRINGVPTLYCSACRAKKEGEATHANN